MSSWNQSVANCCGDCGICMSRHERSVSSLRCSCSGCYGTWCGPCLVCQNANSLNSSAFCCSLLSCCLPWIPAWWLRDSARTRYDIEGDPFCDCCVSFWCPSCVQCQVAKEVKVQGEKEGKMKMSVRMTDLESKCEDF